MPGIIAAADQSAATTLLHDAETTLGTLSKSGGEAWVRSLPTIARMSRFRVAMWI